MRKRTVLFALAVLLFCLPALGEQPYAPWAGLKNNLEQAGASQPGNYAVPYYLGLAYLQEGDRNSAIDQWEKYLRLAPEDFKSVSVRERLTVLKLDQAAEEARRAVGMKTLERKPVENSLAVFNFKNLSDPEFVPFTKALTMSIITDLAKVPQLVLLERIKVQALVTEMNLGATGIVDSETAARAGRFLLAQHITWGEVDTPRDAVRITARVGQTLDSTNPTEVQAQGPQETFFELEKQIVFGIIDALGLTKEKLSASVLKDLEKYHTRNFKAFMLFGKGLDYLDRKDFAEAKAAFEQAGREDPDFGLSTSLEQSTPQAPLTVTGVDMAEEETGVEEDTSPAPAEAMVQSIVTETESAALEISDVAQDQQEVTERGGSITVHW